VAPGPGSSSARLGASPGRVIWTCSRVTSEWGANLSRVGRNASILSGESMISTARGKPRAVSRNRVVRIRPDLPYPSIPRHKVAPAKPSSRALSRRRSCRPWWPDRSSSLRKTTILVATTDSAIHAPIDASVPTLIPFASARLPLIQWIAGDGARPTCQMADGSYRRTVVHGLIE
jgi:hypothetical protein